MTDYKAIHGKNIQHLASDLDSAEGEGQIWFNTTTSDYKTIVKVAGTWSTGGNLNQARRNLAGCGTQTSGLAFGGRAPPHTGETEEYNSYVIRLNQGIVNVTKSYKGKRGLLKNPKLLRDQDKFITNTPKELVELFFSPNIQVKDIMTFEDLWAIFTGPDFIHKDKFDDILEEFVKQIKRTKVPIPTEVENDYPNFVSENAQSQSHYIKLFENFKGSN